CLAVSARMPPVLAHQVVVLLVHEGDEPTTQGDLCCAHRRISRTAHTALQSSGDALPMRTSCSATSNRSAIAELMRSARLPASMSGLGRASVWAVIGTHPAGGRARRPPWR